MRRDDLARTLDSWFDPSRFRDVGENGLQIEGTTDISKVVCGVSANLGLIDAAIQADADALFVHHGLVWGGGIRRLTGWLGERVRRMIIMRRTRSPNHPVRRRIPPPHTRP